jgi:hypothetical protein
MSASNSMFHLSEYTKQNREVKIIRRWDEFRPKANYRKVLSF